MLLVLFWGFIIGSGLLLIAAASRVVGLISPRFGPRLLGTTWPGHFSDPQQQQLARRQVMAQASASTLHAIGTLILAVFVFGQPQQQSTLIAGMIGVGLMGLAVICTAIAWRLQRVLVRQ